MKIKRVTVDGVEVTAPIVVANQGEGYVEVCILAKGGKPKIANGRPVTERLIGTVAIELDAATVAQMMEMGA